MRKAKRFLSILLAILMAVTLIPQFATDTAVAANGDTENKVSDTPTAQSWEDLMESTSKGTKYLGRIWTDKSVYKDKATVYNDDDTVKSTIGLSSGEDFIVELSALSSMSNLTTYTASTEPMDIVLVLDISGSMTSFMSGSRTTRLQAMKDAANDFIELTETANKDITSDDQKSRISIVSYDTNVTLSSDYTVVDDSGASTLQTTVNSLTTKRRNNTTNTSGAMEMANSQISKARDSAKKLVIVLTDGQPTIEGDGSDRDEVAGEAVDYAKTIKDSGATIYSVGIYSDADVSDTSVDTTNGFMHALSSNYPDAKATYSTWWWGTQYISGFTLGEAGTSQGYFMTASTADDLSKVFETIFNEFSSGSGSPTYIDDGEEAHEAGYVTFTDTLGSYMEVKAMKAVVYANEVYTWDGTSETSGNSTTYTYQSKEIGRGDNTAYPNQGNLNEIKITVTKGTDNATGDTITVQIPASILPLRTFTIKQDDSGGDTYTYEETNTWPIRVLYSVGAKKATDSNYTNLIEQLLANPDTDMQSYMAANKSSDGKVYFYSNAYDSKTNATSGSTTATFAPAKGNSFYYFREDTVLYSDENCENVLITAPTESGTYYYKHSYWEETSKGSGEATQKTDIVTVSGKFLTGTDEKVKQDTDGSVTGTENAYYITSGSPRLGWVQGSDDSLYKEKNETSTAKQVISAAFDTSVTPASVVTCNLGNNGRISYDATGELKITKATSAATGHSIPDTLKNKTFAIKVALKDSEGEALTDSYSYDIYDANGEKQSGRSGTIKNGDSISLANGEYAVVTGLPAGATYTLSEDLSSETNWKNVNTSDELTGTLTAGEMSSVTVENEYSATSVTTGDSTATWLQITKQFNYVDGDEDYNDAWDMVSGASFNMTLEPVSTTATGLTASTMPKPETTSGTATSGSKTVGFSNITFDRPGSYVYDMYEEDTAAISGALYSGEMYRVVIVVKDSNGQLEIDTSADNAGVYQIADKVGNYISNPTKLTSLPATITNEYYKDTAVVRLHGTKSLTDTSGAVTSLEGGEFSFNIRRLTADELTEIAKTDENAGTLDNTPHPYTADGSGTLTTAYNEGDGTIGLGAIGFESDKGDFTSETAEGTYTHNYYYIVTENDITGLTNVTKDSTMYRVKVAVTKTVKSDNSVEMSDVVTYEKVTSATDTSGTSADAIKFDNTFSPTAATASFDLQKTLSGRKSIADESYNFNVNLTSAKDAADKDITGGVNLNGITAVTTGGQAGTGTVTFSKANETSAIGKTDELIFTKAGVYTFEITEDKGTMSGVTYDEHKATATVTVTGSLKDGTLSAEVKYSNTGAPSATDATLTDKAAFTNTYSQTVTNKDLNLQVVKNMEGKDAATGDFKFKIEGVATSGGTSADEATKHLVGGTAYTFSTSAPISAGSSLTMNLPEILSFTQADLEDTTATKVYTYKITEVIPDGADKDNKYEGVTYDDTEYTITVTLGYDKTNGLVMTVTSDNSSVDTGSSTSKTLQVASFTNKYTYDPVEVDLDTYSPTQTQFTLTKILENISWDEDQEFNIKMTAYSYEGDAEVTTIPMPEGAEDGSMTITVPANGSDPLYEGINATAYQVKLGKITFSKPGTYTYKLQEIGTDGNPGTGGTEDGIEYDTATGTLQVVVKDNGSGKLTAEAKLYGLADDAFKNTYTTKIQLDELLNVEILNKLTGKDAESGQFKWTVEPVVDETSSVEPDTQKQLIAALFGLKTTENAYSAGASEDGEWTSVPVLNTDGSGITLTGLSIGRTYSFIVKQTTVPEPEATSATSGGYTHNDKATQYKVDVSVDTNKDDQSVLVATVKVNGDVVATITSQDEELQTVQLPYTSTYAEPDPDVTPVEPTDDSTDKTKTQQTVIDNTNAKTGDPTDISVLIAIASIAAICGALALIRRKQDD